MKIMLTEEKVDMQEVRFLLVGGTSSEAPTENPSKDWLTNK